MSLPVGSTPTARKPAAVSLQQPSQKAKACASWTLVIPSSPLILEILSTKRLALQTWYFQELAWVWLRSENMLNDKQEKKPRDHTALSLSSTVKIWPSITGKGTFSEGLEWDGSYLKLPGRLSYETCLEVVLVSYTLTCGKPQRFSLWYQPNNQSVKFSPKRHSNH